MNNLHRKSGSSLLIILLIASAATIIILTGAKALIDAARLTGAKASAQQAVIMAQSGIQDGLLLSRTPGVLPFDLEYGEKMSGVPYGLKPMRRGYGISNNSDEKCTELTNDMTIAGTANRYDSDCPYYDYAVRRLVYSDRVELSSRSFPHETWVSLAAPNNPAITLTFIGGVHTIVQSINYEYCADYKCERPHGGIQSVVTTVPSFSLPATTNTGSVNGVKIKVAYKLAVNMTHIEGFLVATRLGGGGTSILFDKGYTTVDATGYAGNVQKSLLLSMYPGLNWNRIDTRQVGFDSTKGTLSQIDFAKHFEETTGKIIPE